jgi:hypothetical protein
MSGVVPDVSRPINLLASCLIFDNQTTESRFECHTCTARETNRVQDAFCWITFTRQRSNDLSSRASCQQQPCHHGESALRFASLLLIACRVRVLVPHCCVPRSRLRRRVLASVLTFYRAHLWASRQGHASESFAERRFLHNVDDGTSVGCCFYHSTIISTPDS